MKVAFPNSAVGGVNPLIPFSANPLAVTGLVVDRFWPARSSQQIGFRPIVTTDRGAEYRQFRDDWGQRRDFRHGLQLFCQPVLTSQHRMERLIELNAPEIILENEHRITADQLGQTLTGFNKLVEEHPDALTFFERVVRRDTQIDAELMEASDGKSTRDYLEAKLTEFSGGEEEVVLWTKLLLSYEKYFKGLLQDWSFEYRDDIRFQFRRNFRALELPLSANTLNRALRDSNDVWLSVMDPIGNNRWAGYYMVNHREAFLDMHRIANYTGTNGKVYRLLYHVHNHEMLHAMSGKGCYLTDPLTHGAEKLFKTASDPYSMCFTAMFLSGGVYIGKSRLAHFRNGLGLFIPTLTPESGTDIIRLNAWLDEAVTEYLAAQMLCLYDCIEPTHENAVNRDILTYRENIDVMVHMVRRMQERLDRSGEHINVMELIYQAYFENTSSENPARNHQKLIRLT
ncbi:MAG: hypothetical protein HN337_09685, partial [Deltaproteobacteria bacterium]|nr:hypothetical protein [Deltaproteobacteria bacterium]